MRGWLIDWLMLGAVLGVAGCSRQDAPPPVSWSAQTQSSSGSSAEPSAGSGLAVKRGIVVLAQDRSTFRPCGETAELWLLDQADDILARTFAGETSKPPAGSTTLYIEAYGERAPVDPQIPEAAGYGEMLILEEVLYAGEHDAVKGCAAPAPGYIVAARGTEPFWAVEVDDAQIVWRQSGEPQELILSALKAQDAEGAVRYRASGAGHDVDVLIDAQPCRDAMSGEFFAYSAKALLDGKEFNGCARVGR